jgi:ubiquinone/menaquinone biosynthesis C-methylase UbiE
MCERLISASWLRARQSWILAVALGGEQLGWLKWASSVVGIEIVESMVIASRDFAAQKAIENCKFILGNQLKLDLPGECMDVIVSFDVLEHVEKPDMIIPELYRILKPGGKAVIVFTPYLGAFSHHLNYITLFPGMHWLFSPSTNMQAVRDLLQTHRFSHLKVDDFKLVDPTLSFNKKRKVLPTLNGMTGKEYREIVQAAGFRIETFRFRPLLDKFRILGRLGAQANKWLCSVPSLEERLSLNLTSVLRKP